MRSCYRCGWQWSREEQPGYRDVCPQCQSYLHCCANCAIWDSDHEMCTSQTAESVRDARGHNFCEEFRFTIRGGRPLEADAYSREADARRRWESLFKK